jgi:hypothetical protein
MLLLAHVSVPMRLEATTGTYALQQQQKKKERCAAQD